MDDVETSRINAEERESHYENLGFNPNNSGIIDNRDELINTAIDVLTLVELEYELKTIRNRKAPHNINSELIKCSGIIFKLRYLHFLNIC